MGLLDKVKAQATAATEMAKDAAAKGQAKMNDAQAKKAADGMLRDLGAAFYATKTGPLHADHRWRDCAAGDLAAGARVRARPDHPGARVSGGAPRRRPRPATARRLRRHRLRPRRRPTRPPRRPPRPRRRRCSRPVVGAAAGRRGGTAPWWMPRRPCRMSFFAAGWSSLVARRAHNPKVGGSNPPPATQKVAGQGRSEGVALLLPDESIPPSIVTPLGSWCEIPVHAFHCGSGTWLTLSVRGSGTWATVALAPA